MSFRTQLVVANERGQKRLVEPLVYISRLAGQILVPKGFPTDLASFSVGNLALRGKTEEAAALHDWLYAAGACTRAQADAIFHEALARQGVGIVRRSLYYAAVRTAGWAPWRAHRQGRTPGAKFFKAYFTSDISKIQNHP
jgi:hypothetical protein